jgi:hypothetical protein
MLKKLRDAGEWPVWLQFAAIPFYICLVAPLLAIAKWLRRHDGMLVLLALKMALVACYIGLAYAVFQVFQTTGKERGLSLVVALLMFGLGRYLKRAIDWFVQTHKGE